MVQILAAVIQIQPWFRALKPFSKVYYMVQRLLRPVDPQGPVSLRTKVLSQTSPPPPSPKTGVGGHTSRLRVLVPSQSRLPRLLPHPAPELEQPALPSVLTPRVPMTYSSPLPLPPKLFPASQSPTLWPAVAWHPSVAIRRLLVAFPSRQAAVGYGALDTPCPRHMPTGTNNFGKAE